MTLSFRRILLLLCFPCLGLIVNGQSENSSSPAASARKSELPQPATYNLEPVAPPTVAYPSEAAKQNPEGEVTAAMLVSETGQVENTQIYTGPPALASATEQAMRDWTFKPVLVDGKAIPVIARVKVKTQSRIDATNLAPDIAPAAPFPSSVRVSSQVLQGMLQHKVGPAYPENARKAHLEGIVQLRGIIDKHGNVVNLQAVAGSPELLPAAIDAVRQWRYKPYLFMGRPVDVSTNFEIDFSQKTK